MRGYALRQKEHHAEDDLRPDLERTCLPDTPPPPATRLPQSAKADFAFCRREFTRLNVISHDDLSAAWEYAAAHPNEIEASILLNEEV